MKRIHKVLLGFILIFGLAKLSLVFLAGESTFITTSIFYLFIGGLIVILSKKVQRYKVFAFSTLVVLITLFLVEVFLRFGFEYPLTYSERREGKYKSVYSLRFNLENFIAEISGRKLNPYYDDLLDPFSIRDYSSSEFDYPKEMMNRYGFRGSVPEENKKIILMLGDSFTEGIGASADSTYPFLLSTKVKSINDRWAVFNAGVSGNDPYFEFAILKQLVQKITFHEVVFTINMSDVFDVRTRGGADRFLSGGGLKYRKGPLWEPLYAVSYIFRLYVHHVLNIGWSLKTAEENETIDKQVVAELPYLFDSVVEWAKNNNVTVKLVLHPLVQDLDRKRELYFKLSRNLENVKGLQFFDAYNGIMAYDTPENLYWPIDRHFTPEGYNFLSTLVFNQFYKDELKE